MAMERKILKGRFKIRVENATRNINKSVQKGMKIEKSWVVDDDARGFQGKQVQCSMPKRAVC